MKKQKKSVDHVDMFYLFILYTFHGQVLTSYLPYTNCEKCKLDKGIRQHQGRNNKHIFLHTTVTKKRNRAIDYNME